jgi:Gas vesicle synthesis protein GvpO
MTENAKLSARDLTLAAKETISELTGHKAESVTGMEWNGEAWEITVDVLELERVPNTTDVLATYTVKVDDEGRLLGYKRERRYVRGAADDRR